MRTFVVMALFAALAPSPVFADDEDETPDDEAQPVPDDEAQPASDDEAQPADEQPEPPKKKKKKKKRKKKKHHVEEPAGDDDEAVPGISATTDTGDDDGAPARVQLTVEAVAGLPVDGDNRDLFGTGGGGGLGLDVFIAPLLGIHAAASFVYLSGDASMSSTTWISGQIGPRLHLADKIFGAYTHKDAWVDAHFSFGTSGGIKRPGFDLGAAVLWEVAPKLRVGPVLRYQFGSDPFSNNAQLMTLGLAVAYGGRTRMSAPIVDDDDDGDGVANADDQCPAVAAGDNPSDDFPGCPDTDADGIADIKDECPKEPAGDTPDPERNGCPRHDQDGDKIIDREDKCPTEAGPPNPFDPEKHGCPGLVEVVNDKIEILQQIFFENDSATIKEESFPVLTAVAGAIKNLDKQRVRIEGHTDEKGSDAYNLDLSRRRARAVAQWLIIEGGVDPSVLETEGYGKSRPLVQGDDTSKNRRVEFLILGK